MSGPDMAAINEQILGDPAVALLRRLENEVRGDLQDFYLLRAELAELKAKIAEIDKHRWAAARLVCALRAQDGFGIPIPLARDAFKSLNGIAGDDLVERVWNGEPEPAEAEGT